MKIKQKKYYDFYDILMALDINSPDYAKDKAALYSLTDGFDDQIFIDLKEVEQYPEDFIQSYIDGIKLLRRLGIKQNEITILR